MSETRWLLDTSVLVDLLRGHAPAKDWVDALPAEVRFVSVVTVAELLAGCRNRREQRAVDHELSGYVVTWLDEPVSRRAVELYRRHHLSAGVGFFDCLIGATSVETGMTLATLNLRHFEPLEGVRSVRPY
ncbi:MAG: type II toxin-antitoxin system VapC family toxin [Armatimonadetes bacterium]|nr:type II toxin-antitoxin system VapC family toxin [Armatimonadota bacterium]